MRPVTIRNIDNFVDSLWDWGFLDDCFGGTRIKVSDLDGIVERHGNVLILETKSPGAPIPKGQEILFNTLTSQSGFTVLVIWGDANKPVEAQVWGRPRVPADEKRIKDFVASWYKRADRRN
jgi:hypothetical protein